MTNTTINADYRKVFNKEELKKLDAINEGKRLKIKAFSFDRIPLNIVMTAIEIARIKQSNTGVASLENPVVGRE